MSRDLPLDYKLLQALDAVVREQSFERAARALHLTQPAISQRIKQLEQQLAQPVLLRSSPPRPTLLGQQLLGHYRQVSQLERELLPRLRPEAPTEPLRISIAVNADSLATWFLPALTPLLDRHPLALDLVLDDETRSVERLRQGEVFGAVGCHPLPLPGCEASRLGDMEYRLICSPDFARRYFAEGLHLQALSRAPAVAFDHRDDMHVTYLSQHFALPPGGYPCHTVRSSEAFIDLAIAGVAYALIPELQIRSQLAAGTLISLPAPPLQRTLYWHRWLLARGVHQQVSEAILAAGRQALAETQA